MNAMNEDELRVVIALVRKLGGEVTLTLKDLEDAEAMELQRCDPDDFTSGIHYRVRLAPVTLEGEIATEQELTP